MSLSVWLWVGVSAQVKVKLCSVCVSHRVWLSVPATAYAWLQNRKNELNCATVCVRLSVSVTINPCVTRQLSQCHVCLWLTHWSVSHQVTKVSDWDRVRLWLWVSHLPQWLTDWWVRTVAVHFVTIIEWATKSDRFGITNTELAVTHSYCYTYC